MDKKNIIIILLVFILLVLLFGRYAGYGGHMGMMGWGNGPDENFFEEMHDEMEERMEEEIEEHMGGDEDRRGPGMMGPAELNLSGGGLTKVPLNLFVQTNTVALDLSDNELSGALPAEVRNMSKLRVLDLSNNNFTGVPAEVGQLSELELLNLSNNPITGLPYEIGNLQKLKALDLRGTNYAEADLEVIKQSLPESTLIYTD